jgi:hypothetical protein
MARPAKYTDHQSVVNTRTSFDLVVAVAEKAQTDKAPALRTALDLLFDTEDGELKPGDTFEAAVDRAIERMTRLGHIRAQRPTAAV